MSQQVLEMGDTAILDMVGDSPPDLIVLADSQSCLAYLEGGRADIHFCAKYITADLL
jgi:hypothetical protein